MSNKAIPVLAAAVLLGSIAAWYWWPRIAPTPTPPPAVAAPGLSPPEPAIANPIAAAPGPARPALPVLADSDGPFSTALLALPGAGALRAALRPEYLIRHLVATVDNLSRHRLAPELLPLQPTPGKFLVTGDEVQGALDEQNAARYAPLVSMLAGLDMRAVAGLYRQYYPLFQRAYQDLGYPRGYFNDRLVAVIDHLLAIPSGPATPALVRPKVFWEYADPELEARSSGQKLLLRIGPANAAIVERKLRELRALIAATPSAAAASAIAAPAAAPPATTPPVVAPRENQ